MKFFTKLTEDRNYAIGWGVLSFSAVSLFLCVLLIAGALVQFNVFSNTDYTYNTITVEGYAEVSASPDVAVFSFSVREESDTLDVAQNASAEKINKIFEYLKEGKIDTDKDVKTSNYSANPVYEWVQSCYSFDCPPGKNVLKGYEVSQTITVKVRDLDTAGAVLSGVGSRGATDISGLVFEIDDPSKLKTDAREMAVKDAKEKAKALAQELGVDLKGVISFYETGNGGYPVPYGGLSYREDAVSVKDMPVAPVLPSGENEVTSSVSITYKIK